VLRHDRLLARGSAVNIGRFHKSVQAADGLSFPGTAFGLGSRRIS
jgi:hypothetical protein